MIYQRFLINLSSTSLLAALLLTSSVTIAKKPQPPAPEPEADPLPIGTTELVSKSSDGTFGNAQSNNQSMSADGRFIVMASFASNLVADDTNGKGDIFVHDRLTGITERVSVADDGTQADNESFGASISDDGRFVTFYSRASNLVSGVQDFFPHIYVHDRINRSIERVSIASDGTLANSSNYDPVISGDGRYVAFSSFASNLVTDDTNGAQDIFIHDRLNSTTKRISVDSTGNQSNNRSASPSLSANGLSITFLSSASNLVTNDTNGVTDIFVHHLANGSIQRVSLSSDGTEGNASSGGPEISDNGQVVTFSSTATNLVAGDTNGFYDVFIHDLLSSTTERVSVTSTGAQLHDDSFSGDTSADGRYTTFISYANELDTSGVNWWYSDIFVYDRITKSTELVSLSSDGIQANEESNRPTISADGRFVGFHSYAIELVPNGTSIQDVYIRDRNP